MKEAEFSRGAISVNELNKVTGVTVSTIRKWLRDGDMKGVKAGKRKWLIPIAEVKRIVGL
jgi:excisionase family DNA binding protein